MRTSTALQESMPNIHGIMHNFPIIKCKTIRNISEKKGISSNDMISNNIGHQKVPFL